MAADLQDPRESPYASTQLQVTVTDAADALVIEPRGEVDIVSAPLLSDCLLAAANDCAQPIVIDLAAVSFMDSTGLDVLIRAQRTMARKGLPLRVRNVRDPVRQMFGITGTGPLFDLDA